MGEARRLSTNLAAPEHMAIITPHSITLCLLRPTPRALYIRRETSPGRKTTQFGPVHY